MCDPAPLKVGVLALQGAFAEHDFSLRRAYTQLQQQQQEERPGLGPLQVVEVRTSTDMAGLQGLVIPGGESTTMSKFLQRSGLLDTIKAWMSAAEGGHPRPTVWGTCAGLILLADRVLETKDGGQASLGGLGVTTTRNIYGRQKESFEGKVKLNPVLGGSSEYKGVFIRAPGIKSVDDPRVTVLASLTSTDDTDLPVAVEQGPFMATSFHPELTDDLRWHHYFLAKLTSSTSTSSASVDSLDTT